MPLILVDIVNPTIPSTYVDIGYHLHPHMECDQPTLPEQVVDYPSSHEFCDFELPSKEAILDVMASIDKPKENDNHHESILPSL